MILHLKYNCAIKSIMKLCCPPYSEVNYALQWQIAIACVSVFMNQLSEVSIKCYCIYPRRHFYTTNHLSQNNPPHSAEVDRKCKEQKRITMPVLKMAAWEEGALMTGRSMSRSKQVSPKCSRVIDSFSGSLGTEWFLYSKHFKTLSPIAPKL